MRADATRTVGNGVDLPRLGIGTAPFGWLFETIEADDAVATARAAFAAGIRLADTAPGYGLGLAEERLGRALAELPDPHRVVVSTKVGRLLRPVPEGTPARFPGAPDLQPVPAWAPGEVRRSLEESLTRLGLDRVDILYAHDPDDAEDELRRSAIPELIALREEGLVGAVGVGMNQAEMPARLVRDDLGLDLLLVAGRYSLLVHTALEDLLPLCADRNVGVVLGGVLGTGILVSDAPGARFDYRPPDDRIATIARDFRAVCAAHGVAPAAAALQFPFGHPAVAAVVAGMRSPDEAVANTAAFSSEIPSAFWRDLVSAGVLPEHVPTP